MFSYNYKPARFLGLALILTGCGGYTAIHYPAVPVSDMLTRVVANPNFHMIDAGSFADAFNVYPVALRC